jgi:hypothetical protein
MSQLRRRFLTQFGVAAAALALGKSSVVLAAAANAKPTEFGYSAFVPLVGRAFKLDHAGAKAPDMNLVKVVALKSAKGYADERKAREQCFTLVFRSAEKSTVADGVYEFSTAGQMTFSAFMSPIGNDGRSYQVVFNRI